MFFEIFLNVTRVTMAWVRGVP